MKTLSHPAKHPLLSEGQVMEEKASRTARVTDKTRVTDIIRVTDSIRVTVIIRATDKIWVIHKNLVKTITTRITEQQTTAD